MISNRELKVLCYFRTNQSRPEGAHADSGNMEKFNRDMAKFKTSASEFIEEGARQNPRKISTIRMGGTMTKKAIIFLTASVREQRRYGDVPVEPLSLSSQREVIKRKATERNCAIVGEFVIPKPSNRVGDPLFRRMLDFISAQGVDYVLIYPDRPHRVYKESALIEAAIIQAGAQVMSVQDVDSVPDILRGFLSRLGSLDVSARRGAQLRAKWKREQKAA